MIPEIAFLTYRTVREAAAEHDFPINQVWTDLDDCPELDNDAGFNWCVGLLVGVADANEMPTEDLINHLESMLTEEGAVPEVEYIWFEPRTGIVKAEPIRSNFYVYRLPKACLARVELAVKNDSDVHTTPCSAG